MLTVQTLSGVVSLAVSPREQRWGVETWEGNTFIYKAPAVKVYHPSNKMPKALRTECVCEYAWYFFFKGVCAYLCVFCFFFLLFLQPQNVWMSKFLTERGFFCSICWIRNTQTRLPRREITHPERQKSFRGGRFSSECVWWVMEVCMKCVCVRVPGWMSLLWMNDLPWFTL